MFFLLLNQKTIQLKLSDEKNPFISLIYSTAEAYIRGKESDEFENEHEFMEKVTEVRNIMEDVLQRLEKTEKARLEFLNKFPSWAECRKATIEELNAIGDAIHSDKFKGNVSKIFGSSLGVFGGAALLAGVACPPLLIAGGVATALSITSSIGTTVTESVYLKTRLEQAKTVTEKDQEQFKSLQEWFDRSNDLMEAIDDIFGFNLVDAMPKEMKLLCTEFQKLKGQLDKNKMCKLLPILTNVIQILCSGHMAAKFGVKLSASIISFIIPLLIVVVNIYYRMTVTENLTPGPSSNISTIMSLSSLFSPKKTMKSAFSRAPSVAGKVPQVASKFMKAAAGIGIAMDSITILLTANDLRKGSVSEQEKELKGVAEDLQEEYDFIENVYKELRNQNFDQYSLDELI